MFSLREFGSSFATRERGAELRAAILAHGAADHAVTIDFADVTNVSYSFADELVGRLPTEDFDARNIELTNMNATVERIVRSARRRRIGALAT
ncbi:MAG TPA: STAS-like domain-containing protein [Solirubrobacteraceae bacterium]|jgi:hypothetical protein|nr:STAS-like domain-containing protein [Solirubrobacteraceae bacterium]